MVNMKELEIPLAMENDENVEKAEAYAKQLEDVSEPWIYIIFHSVIYACFYS